MSHFSFRPEVLYKKNSLSGTFENEQLIINTKINTQTIVLPFLIRYTYPSMDYRVFGHLGLVYSNNITTEKAFNTILKQNMKQLPDEPDISSKLNMTMVSRQQMGYSVGIGLEKRLGLRHYIFIEMRYSEFHAFSEETLNHSKSHFIVGLGF